MGKTALLRDLERLSVALSIRVVKGFGSAIDETTPLRVFSFVMRELLGLEEDTTLIGPAALLRPLLDMGVRRPQPRPLDILKGTGTDVDLSKDAPLLAPIVGPELVPDGPTVRLSPDNRQERLLALCVEIIRRKCKRHPTLLLLDNVQWMDEVSWKLVRMLHRDVRELLIVACIRSEGPPSNVRLSAMSNAAAFRRTSGRNAQGVKGVQAAFLKEIEREGADNFVRLKPLLEDDLKDMAQKLLDVKTIPPALSSFLSLIHI